MMRFWLAHLPLLVLLPANAAQVPSGVPLLQFQAQSNRLAEVRWPPQAEVGPAANPTDVGNLDAIIGTLYTVISGPAGKRDWDRFRSLFISGARLIPTNSHGVARARVLTVEEYIQRAGPHLEKEGFFEREVARRTESFGSIAHVFSTYESRHNKDDAKPFQRGINSIQLMNDGQRWWVVTVFWQGEDEENPLPGKYLPSKN